MCDETKITAAKETTVGEVPMHFVFAQMNSEVYLFFLLGLNNSFAEKYAQHAHILIFAWRVGLSL